MTGALAWLLGSKAGRYVVIGLLGAAAVGLLVLRVYSAGRAAEKAKQAQQSLKNLRSRIQTDDEVGRLSSEERRRRLQEWTADDAG